MRSVWRNVKTLDAYPTRVFPINPGDKLGF